MNPISTDAMSPTEPAGGGQPELHGGESPAQSQEVGGRAGEEAFVSGEEYHHQGGQQGLSRDFPSWALYSRQRLFWL